MRSVIEQRGPVAFPNGGPERHYMIPFLQHQGLPYRVRHWQRTVDQMLDGIKTDGEIYLMVDRRIVPAGHLLRRPGLHVDGHWLNVEAPRHRTHRGGPSHVHSPLHYAEGILLASNIAASEAFVGEWNAPIGPEGEVADEVTVGLQRVELTSHTCWAGNTAGMLHRATPQAFTAIRTLVRLNVQGWEPQ